MDIAEVNKRRKEALRIVATAANCTFPSGRPWASGDISNGHKINYLYPRTPPIRKITVDSPECIEIELTFLSLDTAIKIIEFCKTLYEGG